MNKNRKMDFYLEASPRFLITIVSHLPLSKLFLELSKQCSPVSPFSPNIVTVTLASVPAPLTSPVYVHTLYL